MANSNMDSLTPNEKPEFINLNVHKAGLDGLDQNRINQIIQEASKGSNFYSFQQRRQKRVDQQIKQLKAKADRITEHEKQIALNKADRMLIELEQYRVLNRIIVHFDMDMFFAAVEIKKNPKLADVPMAVGSMSMISTSNYIARKFGVRSAMAGFIAKKLCPQLILIKPNFKHYSEESKVVMNIISQYDPNLRNFSLDEVYIDLTDYVFSKYSSDKNVPIEEITALDELNDDIWQFAFNIVNNIRTRVYDETKLTISAGISCNTKLAKICTDINKPNGQFMIKGNRQLIMDFVSKTELRKFTGIGPVTGQLLSALNIVKGADIYNERALIMNLFSEMNAIYYLKIYLGIGSSYLNEDETMQKSHSRERTVGQVSDLNEMCKLLKNISGHLANDLQSESQLCKTITLKLKKTSFEVFIKCRTINKYTDNEEDIYSVAKELLEQEVNKSPNNKYRLIGLRVSNLCSNFDENSKQQKNIDSNQLTLSQYLKSTNQQPVNKNHGEINSNSAESFQYECVLCDETFSDEAEYEMHKHFCNGDFNIKFITSNQNFADQEMIMETNDSFKINNNNQENESNNSNSTEITSSSMNDFTEESESEFQFIKCPICQSNTLFKDNNDLNRHIDLCLNREICIELTAMKSKNHSMENGTKTNFQTKRIIMSNNESSPNSGSEQNASNRIDFKISKKITKKNQKRIKIENSIPLKDRMTSNQTKIDHYFQSPSH